MKVFVILFCFLVGFACVDSQRVEIGDDELGSRANAATKASSPNSDEALIEEDQQNNRRRSGPVYSPVKSVGESSEEVEAASEKPSQPDPVNAVKPVTLKVEKNGQTVQVDLWSIMKSSHQLSSANRSLTKVNRDSPKQSSEIHVTDDAGLEPKARRWLLRKKRDAEWDTWEKNELFEEGAGAGLEWRLYTFRKDQGFARSIDARAEKEKKLVNSLQTTGTVSDDVLNEYKDARTKEDYHCRGMIKGSGRHETLVGDYVYLLTTGAVGYKFDLFGVRAANQDFFSKPSPNLVKFKAMKRKEVEMMTEFLNEKIKHIYEGPRVNEFSGEKSSSGAGSSGGAGSSSGAGSSGGAGSSSGAGSSGGAKSEGDYDECPKKKRQSESVAAKMNAAQEFVVFVCVVIGVFVVHLQWLEIGEGDLKDKEKASTVKNRIRSTGMRVDRIRQIQPIA